MNDQHDPRLDSIQRIEDVYGPTGWTWNRRRAWAAAVADLSPEAVEAGSLDLVAKFEQRTPTPAHLRGYAVQHERRTRPRRKLAVDLPRDQAALIDAKAAREIYRNQAAHGREPLFSEEEMDEMIAGIEQRLDARVPA